jgi:hypothetical protein
MIRLSVLAMGVRHQDAASLVRKSQGIATVTTGAARPRGALSRARYPIGLVAMPIVAAVLVVWRLQVAARRTTVYKVSS